MQFKTTIFRRVVFLCLAVLLASALPQGPVAWALPSQLTADSPLAVSPDLADDSGPCLLRLSDGEMVVFWSSERSGNADIWYAESADEGANWSDPVRLTVAPTADLHPAAAELGDGRLMVVWSSEKGSNSDLAHGRGGNQDTL